MRDSHGTTQRGHHFVASLAVLTILGGLVAPQITVAQAWPTGTPESQGFDSAMLAASIERMAATSGAPDSVQIVRNGVLVLDAYFYPYLGDRPHDVASVQKSVTSTLIGIAIEHGFLEGVNQPIMPLFAADYPSVQWVGGKQDITLFHLLTMTSGLDCTAGDGVAILEMQQTDDWVEHVLNLPMVSPPGASFAYCTPTVHLLDAAISKATGQSLLEFAQQYLFEPLGFGDVEWPGRPEGISTGRLALHPNDMARLGQLFLNGGHWGGQQILSSSWIAESVTPWNPGYGYLWWINGVTDYSASGNGGQRIHVLHDENTVIVTTGSAGNVFDADLLRALGNGTPLPPNDDAYQQLILALTAARTEPSPTPGYLPSISTEVSGRTYQLEPNRFGLRCSTTYFDPNDPSQASMVMTLEQDGVVVTLPPLGIGLDGVPRFSQFPVGEYQLALEGGWNAKFPAPTSFTTTVNPIGGVDPLEVTSEFGDDLRTVLVTFHPMTTYTPDEVVQGHQISDGACPGGQSAAIATGNLYSMVNNGDLSGTIVTWDDASYSVFGEWNVNLGAAAGINDMEVPPTYGFVGPNAGSPAHGTFQSSLFSGFSGFPWNGVLRLTNSGSFVCPNSVGACGSERASPLDPFAVTYVAASVPSGSFVDAGPETLPTVLNGLPVSYAADGDQTCHEVSPLIFSCSGRVHLNASRAETTAAGGTPGDPGDSVEVAYSAIYTSPQTGVETPVDLTIVYDAVTSEGYTTVSTLSQAPGDIPFNFSVDLPGFSPIFMNISTTAVYTPPIRVCARYSDVNEDGVVDGTTAEACSLRLLHNDDVVPDEFENKTMSASDPRCPFPSDQMTCGDLCINTVTHHVCALVQTLSPFVLAVGCAGDPASSCGDSLLQTDACGEECDDGNQLGGDGCSAACRQEFGFECSGVASSCSPLTFLESKAQQACIRELNKRGGMLAKGQGRVARRCIRDKGLGKVEKLGLPQEPQTAQACLVANDVQQIIDNGKNYLLESEEQHCVPDDLPDYAYTGGANTIEATLKASQAVVFDLFGHDLDGALISTAASKQGAQCQQEAHASAQKLFDTLWREAAKGQTLALRGTSSVPLAEGPADLQAAILDHLDGPGAMKITRQEDKLTSRIEKRCAPVEDWIGVLFPGSCSAEGSVAALATCVAEVARCLFCEGLVETEALDLDCDIFDDSESDASCP